MFDIVSLYLDLLYNIRNEIIVVINKKTRLNIGVC